MTVTTEVREYVTVLPNGIIEHKIVTEYFDDGFSVGSKGWRAAYPPTTDKLTLTGRPLQIAEATWTQEVIDAYVASLPEPLTGENNV